MSSPLLRYLRPASEDPAALLASAETESVTLAIRPGCDISARASTRWRTAPRRAAVRMALFSTLRCLGVRTLTLSYPIHRTRGAQFA